VRAVEERDADFTFQIANLFADSRLRNVKVPGGVAEPFVIGDCAEVSKMPQLHNFHPIGNSDSTLRDKR
jgi:hypothetical protein